MSQSLSLSVGSPHADAAATEEVRAAIDDKFSSYERTIHTRIDRMFAVLMMLQWIAAMFAALLITPRTWIGAQSDVHPHLIFAVVCGGLLAGLPAALAVWCPGRFGTRLVISISQVLFSSLLIHLLGGRIETHFHVFGSLAFLAAYRDWRVLVVPTVLVAIDHLVRGSLWPESVFGVATAANWRWMEHAGWVLFEDIFLLIIIRKSRFETRQLAEHTANLEIAKKAAEDNERRFRASFDQAAVGMCHLDLDGNFLRINNRFCEIVGYSSDELKSMQWHDLTHSADLDRDVEKLNQLRLGELQHFTHEVRHIHQQQHVVWVQTTLSTVFGRSGKPSYLTAVVNDISAEVTANEQLLKSHQEIRKLSLVASKTRHSIIITDAEGRAEWANDAFTQLTGCDASELIGEPAEQFLSRSAAEPEAVLRAADNIRRRQRTSEELEGRTQDGQKYWLSLEIDPVFDADGNVSNFIATQADISDRKEREAQLQGARKRAEAANHAKSQFLANMSHEIRTPLNGIMGFAELLSRDGKNASDEDFNEYLYTIKKCSRHLLELINEILDLSKIEAGQLQVESVECSPQQVIAEVVSVLRVRAQEKGIALEYRWEGCVPTAICSDPHRLKQLLMNLIGNAIKFTEQGSVVVVAYLDTSGGESLLAVEVRDTGIGIAIEKLDSIFEPFMQADNSITRSYGGTGLGLTISRRIAEALGGSLQVTSSPGVGSVFTLRVATGDLSDVRMLEHPGDTVAGDIVDDDSGGPDIGGLRVLVVDDGDTNRRLVSLMLERGGAKVKMADNGKVAVQMARDYPFDVILMDMQMPVMDGYTATRKLRQEGFADPIIALTAHAMKGDQDKCEAAGCNGYLPKPVDTRQLLNMVAALAPKFGGGNHRPQRVPATADDCLTQDDEIHSLLPTDDPEIREIVEEFIDTLASKVLEMERAAEQGDFAMLGNLAHWLKGAGGTVGFACFTEPARLLEDLAKECCQEDSMAIVERIRSFAERIVVTTPTEPLAAGPT